MTTSQEIYPNIHPVFELGITQEEQVKRYTECAAFYEKDVVGEGRYTAPTFTAEAIGQFFPSNRANYVILDIAAGTGLVAQELRKLGFETMDAFEPSEGMVKIAREKNIYRDIVVAGLSKDRLPYNDDSYDAVTICGWHGSFQHLCDALEEIIRVLKPGGVLCITTIKLYMTMDGDFRDSFLPLLDKVEGEGKLEKIEVKGHMCYPFNHEGVRLVYKKR